MTALVNDLVRHWQIGWQLFGFALKKTLEYRLNSLVWLFHSLASMVLSYGVIIVVFANTSSLVGWSKPEIIMLFALFNGMYGLASASFIIGAKEFMRRTVRQGELDFMLLKPVDVSFLALFQAPQPQELLTSAVGFGIFILQLSQLPIHLSAGSVGIFLICCVLSLSCIYSIISIYACLAFWLSRGEQIMYTFDKTTDFAQYPTTLFPGVVQGIFFLLFPIALFSFVPLSFLLGRGSPSLFITLVGIWLSSGLVKRWLWQQGLRRYSSASS